MKALRALQAIALLLLALRAEAATNVDLTIAFDNYTSSAENDLLTNFTVSDEAFTQLV